MLNRTIRTMTAGWPGQSSVRVAERREGRVISARSPGRGLTPDLSWLRHPDSLLSGPPWETSRIESYTLYLSYSEFS
jgi:hypothetical protein